MNGKPGMAPLEVEDRGNDMKLQASVNGAYDPVKAGEVDDDGRFPKRSGPDFALRIAESALQSSLQGQNYSKQPPFHQMHRKLHNEVRP